MSLTSNARADSSDLFIKSLCIGINLSILFVSLLLCAVASRGGGRGNWEEGNPEEKNKLFF